MSTVLHIKNMVCPRCIMAVENLFVSEGYHVEDTQLGWVKVSEQVSQQELHALRNKLRDIGFELMEDQQAMLIEQIKNVVIERVHHKGLEFYERKLSEEIAQKTRRDYHYLSRLFSSKEGITIERYIILQKIEKAKELLIYDQHSISEIAFLLGYSSASHISRQFREVTGLSPSEFRKQREQNRNSLDQIR